ncbi:protein of unknown function [Methylorubrum extorquens DM4]|uniref:Uncharacterized protein n=1 Tax=Methylorubrum extorquens (strain DSM 6343 / CIP 106787 / DM4) TaxID=661410 RepID=C7CDN2_METED|nr:protein of unknown function [Methylorubrum extorquens DM4]
MLAEDVQRADAAFVLKMVGDDRLAGLERGPGWALPIRPGPGLPDGAGFPADPGPHKELSLVGEVRCR